MIGNTYLKLKLLKRKINFKALCHPYKGTRKVEDFYKLSYEEQHILSQEDFNGYIYI